LAVVLCDLLDFPYSEAAEILDVREGTIKSRLFRARGMLARELHARGYMEEEAVWGSATGNPDSQPGVQDT
jgi:DNA-directed RNA polymerase specialized sigma24 family protein